MVVSKTASSSVFSVTSAFIKVALFSPKILTISFIALNPASSEMSTIATP